MTKAEIRNRLEQMDNVSVDYHSIRRDGDTYYYACNHSGRKADIGWFTKTKPVADVMDFQMFA